MAPPPDALVIGCGYLGRRVAALWRDEGRRVAALTRGRAAELAALGLEPVVGDVLDPESLRHLPVVSTVLYAVALDRSKWEASIAGLGNVLAALGWEGEAPAEPLPLSPSPLGGEGRGGGWMAKVALTPHPNPPP
ncbi:MAG TPA: hypothetical protein VFG68_05790, partial [Fimbriiglobus sp.]|nr:hypothetical protein [Fimbriiglobus sp.]